MFERRLEAIQKGRYWITRLHEGLNHPDKELDNLNLLNLVSEARSWYAKNAFHIHGGVPYNCPVDRFLFQWGLLEYSDMPSDDMWKEARDLFGTKAEELFRSLEHGR